MTDRKIYRVTEPYLDISCSLGEGPFYEEYSNKLRFSDIEKNELHYVDLSVGPSSHEVISLKHPMTVTADIEGDDERFIFIGKNSIGVFDKTSGESKVLKELWNEDDKKAGKHQNLRGNDGKCDSQGHFFFGVMTDPLVRGQDRITKEGTLFRLDPDLSLHTILDPITIPNGISWSHDNKTMFWTDTPDSEIYAFDYSISTGVLSNQRSFFHASEGYPDGHAMDVEDHLWVALFGAAKVVRVSPQGEVVAEIHLPTRSVTCPVFAGEDLYITTAAEQDPTGNPESAKNQGRLYRCNVGIRGNPVHRFPLSG